MAENTVLSALRHAAVQHHGDQFEDQLFIDFTGAAHIKDITGTATANSAYNLASGDLFKAFNIPQYGVVTDFGWQVDAASTDATATFTWTGVDATSTGEEMKSATAIGSVYASVHTFDTSPVMFASDAGYIKITGGTATNTGKVTFFIRGYVAKRAS